MKWFRFDEQHPAVSGKYLTFDAEIGYFCTLYYSSRHQKFNAFDSLDEAKNAMKVTHWCVLEPPIDYDNGGNGDVFAN